MLKKRFVLVCLLLLGLALAACETNDNESDDASTVDPLSQRGPETAAAATQQVPLMTAAAEQTRQAELSLSLTVPVTPTVTPPPEELIVTRTPEATVDVNVSDDYLGNAYAQDDWLQESFTDVDGNTYRLADFRGQVMLIQTLNTECASCRIQAADIREIAEQFAVESRPYSIVYIMLNIDTDLTPRALQNWANQNDVPQTEALNWIVGTASPGLVSALVETFGDSMVEMPNTNLIFVDVDGVSHINNSEPLGTSRVRSALVFYADPVSREEEAPLTEEDAEGPTTTEE
ncbi:MAG: redoxin domain-containing protein [Chloroflexi bacterium]|nr:redoxin domain-containing protein [Chloroflexota bacterium]